MAYTYHTVQSAERELRVVDDAIARNSRELQALRMRPQERRNQWAENVHVNFLSNLRRRRDILAGELEKAKENERLGIPPLGPQPTRREAARPTSPSEPKVSPGVAATGPCARAEPTRREPL